MQLKPNPREQPRRGFLSLIKLLVLLSAPLQTICLPVPKLQSSISSSGYSSGEIVRSFAVDYYQVDESTGYWLFAGGKVSLLTMSGERFAEATSRDENGGQVAWEMATSVTSLVGSGIQPAVNADNPGFFGPALV